MEPQSTGMTLPRWAKVLMALVTIVLLGLGTIYLLGIAERGRWERYAATLREAGEPLTFKEIEARRADVPDERNSALVIEAALEEFPLDSNPPDYVLVLRFREPEDDLVKGVPRYVIDDSREFLEAHRPLLNARKLSCGNKTERGKRTWEILASLAATCHQRSQDLTQHLRPYLILPQSAQPSGR